ncbi:MAG: FtsW/RodA/SpoVE family cell cycle protein [Clostridiales bacterium]|nr:FtsW/RodA/SpoVE family cell cycle protein [Clostridiales bacterium]
MDKDTQAITKSRLQKSHRHMSLAFLVVWLVLVSFGLLMMFSASYGISYIQSTAKIRTELIKSGVAIDSAPVRAIVEADASAMARKQARITLVGTIGAVVLGALVHFRRLTRPVYRAFLYLFITASLLYCQFGGVVVNGARRWIYIGTVGFQPSELAKVGAVFFLAGYLASRRRKRVAIEARGQKNAPSASKQAFLDVTWPVILMGLWVILTLIQPHLSGALIIFLISVIVFVMADIPMKSRFLGTTQLVVVFLVVAIIFGAGYQLIAKKSPTEFVANRFAHVFKRVDTFQDRDAANEDDRMQIEQAELALGSGGLTGRGIGRSVQKLNWLSEAHNDFILPIIGEELGFVGVSAVVLLFLAFLATGIMVARQAATHMGMLVAAGNTILIALQAFLNMAVTTSLIPTTGISLPFFSYGGTANLFFAVSAGLVLCVSKSCCRVEPDIARVIMKQDARSRGGKKPRQTVEEDDEMGYAV